MEFTVCTCCFEGQRAGMWGNGKPGVCASCSHLVSEHSRPATAEDRGSIAVGRPKTEPEDQPMPTFSDRPFIHDLVAADIAARGELGKRRYGTKLQAFNGRSSLQDAYEEGLDLCCYLKQLIEEEKELHG